MDADQYLNYSSKLETQDLDWNLAKEVGLTDDERFILTYFSDIESQTILYLRDLLRTQSGLNSEVIGFLSIWNYEEYFHGVALAKLLKVCGSGLEDQRISQVRNSSSFSEKIEAAISVILSKIWDTQFTALYMAWGATQELTTLKGYEQLSRSTQNPILKTLCERIAKQERRHFAWYFNNASVRLKDHTSSQKFARFLMERFWSPVGAGVKTPAEVSRLMSSLFPPPERKLMAQAIDQKISSLPGLHGLSIMSDYIEGLAQPIT